MRYSKRKIDIAGKVMSTWFSQDSSNISESELEKYIDKVDDAESIFDYYRESHLRPMVEASIDIQKWLRENFNGDFYIAYRLKRKPQIIRKLNRFKTRLTQLQDIGGIRIILNKNKDVDTVKSILSRKLSLSDEYSLLRETDYREKGRDDSGYRALHIIVDKKIESDYYKLEIQVRSQVQHYWAESIERTSVISGYYLKEGDGPNVIIDYFKLLSDIFFEIELNRKPSPRSKIELDKLRVDCEKVLKGKNRVIEGKINEHVIKELEERERKISDPMKNWILVFDWNSGSFVGAYNIKNNPDEMINSYVEKENMFPVREGYEVVMVGAPTVAIIRETHSHYFGINDYDNIIESLDQAVIGFSRKGDIDIGSREILYKLFNKYAWNRANGVSYTTMKNHLCKNVISFDYSLNFLLEKGYVISERGAKKGPFYLNIKKKSDIESIL